MIHRILPLGTYPSVMLATIKSAGCLARAVTTEWRGEVCFIGEGRVWATAYLHKITTIGPEPKSGPGFLWCFRDIAPVEGVAAPDSFDPNAMFENGPFLQPQFLASGAQVALNRFLESRVGEQELPMPEEPPAVEESEALTEEADVAPWEFAPPAPPECVVTELPTTAEVLPPVDANLLALQRENARLHDEVATLRRRLDDRAEASQNKTFRFPWAPDAPPPASERLMLWLGLCREVRAEYPISSNTREWVCNIKKPEQMDLCYPMHERLAAINPKWSRWESLEEVARRYSFEGTRSEWLELELPLAKWHVARAAIDSIFHVEDV